MGYSYRKKIDIEDLQKKSNYEEDYKKSAERIKAEIPSYDNGHSAYMIVDVDKEAFTDFLIKLDLEQDYSDEGRRGIGELRFEEGNGYTVAKFQTWEYGACLNPIIEEAFPHSIVYGLSQWDEPDVEAPKDAFETGLNDCFYDEYGQIRLDIDIIDKKSGVKNSIGDLIIVDLNDLEDVDIDGTIVEIEPNDEAYKTLMSFLNENDKQKVYRVLEEARTDLRNEKEQEFEKE